MAKLQLRDIMTQESLYYSAPNRLVLEYFQIAKSACDRSSCVDTQDLERRDAIVTIIMSFMAVEAFMNFYFRLLVEDQRFILHREWLLSDIRDRVSIDKKLKKWPKAILGRGLDFGRDSPRDFMKLKAIRNKLVHFASDHETITPLPGFVMHDMVNTSDHDTISKREAKFVLDTTIGLIRAIFALQQLPEEAVRAKLQVWCGDFCN